MGCLSVETPYPCLSAYPGGRSTGKLGQRFKTGPAVIFAAGDRLVLWRDQPVLKSAGGLVTDEQERPTLQPQPLEKVLKLYFDGTVKQSLSRLVIPISDR